MNKATIGRLEEARRRVRAATLAGVAALALLRGASGAAQPPPCVGDCDGSGNVSVAELVTGAGIALGHRPSDQCAALDRDRDGVVRIDELVAAIDRALRGCFFGVILLDRAELCFHAGAQEATPAQDVAILAVADHWSATTTAAWLQVEPSAGRGAANLRVTVAADDVADGTHSAEVVIADGTGAARRVSVHLSVFAPALAAGWEMQTVSSVGGRGEQTALALDRDGRPAITFLRHEPPRISTEIWLSRWNGCAWSSEAIEQGVTSSLAFDSRNRAHVAFNSTDLLALRYARREPTGWEIATVDEAASGVTGYRPSLVVDADDHSHVSFQIKSGLFDLRYAFFDGARWTVETVDSIASTGWNSSLALDAAGAVHISYHTDPSALNYAARHDGTWIMERIEGGGRPTSLVLDSTGTALVAHRNQGSHRRIRLVTRSGAGTWNGEDVAPVSNSERRCASLALDSTETPHIAYNDPDTHSLNYASPEASGEWLIEVVDEDPGGANLGDHCALRIDDADIAHISYLDLGRGVLKYARGPAMRVSP